MYHLTLSQYYKNTDIFVQHYSLGPYYKLYNFIREILSFQENF